MKIDNSTRYRSLPLNGVKLDRAEKKAAQPLIETLKGLPHTTLRLMLEALAEEALRLEAAQVWTGTDTEPERREQHEQMLLTCFAVNAAYEHALTTYSIERYAQARADRETV